VNRAKATYASWSSLSRALSAGAAALLLIILGSGPSFAGDGTGFLWGTDGNNPVPGSGASPCPSSSEPWKEPNVTNSGCGNYALYIGEVGGYYSLPSTGCSGSSAWNSTAASESMDNWNAGIGSGLGAYWFGAGPGMDNGYDGTTAEATTWGAWQAQKAANAAASYPNTRKSAILGFDIELGSGEDDYGWNSVKVAGDCETTHSSGIATAVDRADASGFRNYIFNDTPYFPVYYSSQSAWNSIMGSSSTVATTYEWSAHWCDRTPGPTDFSQSGCDADFFAGQDSSNSCAILWQWYGGANDYDQYDHDRYTTSTCEG